MKLDSKIYVTGHSGLVGQAIVQELYAVRGHCHVIVTGHQQLDLLEPSAVDGFFQETKPEYVFHCAARVGGIVANDTQSAEFLMDNLRMQTNVIQMAHKHGAKRLLFFGSSCAYPKFAQCPIPEEALLTGELEPTNRAYAIAKIAGIEMCNAYRKQYGCDFVSCMPTNLYGIGDHYDLENSHVLPGMIRRIHEAKTLGAESVTLWGSGTPTREFLFASDIAQAAITLMNAEVAPSLTNITSGREVALSILAEIVAEVIGFSGKIVWDSGRPDGTPRRVLDGSRMAGLGWKPLVCLDEGIKLAYQDYICQLEKSAH